MASRITPPFALWVLLLGVTAALCANVADGSVADINHLTDDILAGVGTYVTDAKLVNIDLPDVRQEFSFSMLWILSVTGVVQLTGGALNNFKNVNRYEASQLTFIQQTKKEDNPDQIFLQTGIELPQLEGSYNFEVKVGAVKQKGKVTVSVSGVKAKTSVNMFMSTLKPSVVELKIVDLGKIKVHLQDGLVGWLASGIANVAVGTIKRTLKDTIEKQLPEVINEKLAELDIAAMLRPSALTQSQPRLGINKVINTA